jgi:tripartite-type tricarboxylate transporter receptor subunit TctC
MKRLAMPIVAVVAAGSLMMGVWAQSAFAAFLAGGRTITLTVGNTAGGSTDLGARILAAGLEKQLESPVRVTNKPGASGQVALAEVAQSKPDGYTLIATVFYSTITTYLDPARKAVYNRQSFAPVANYNTEPYLVVVKADSRLKTVKELVDAAKVNPGAMKAGIPGILSGGHIGSAMWGKMAGMQFAEVQFPGAGDVVTALLGGHVDIAFLGSGALLSHFKGGLVRVLAIMDQSESEFYPGVKTLRSQGYGVEAASTYGVAAPAGTPKQIVDTLADAVKKAMGADDIKKRMDELGRTPRYLGPAAYAAYWQEMETLLKPLVEEITKK